MSLQLRNGSLNTSLLNAAAFLVVPFVETRGEAHGHADTNQNTAKAQHGVACLLLRKRKQKQLRRLFAGPKRRDAASLYRYANTRSALIAPLRLNCDELRSGSSLRGSLSPLLLLFAAIGRQALRKQKPPRSFAVGSRSCAGVLSPLFSLANARSDGARALGTRSLRERGAAVANCDDCN